MALALRQRFPTIIVRHKMLEILLWLAQFGIRFIHNEAKDLTQRVRRCGNRSAQHLDRGQSRGEPVDE